MKKHRVDADGQEFYIIRNERSVDPIRVFGDGIMGEVPLGETKHFTVSGPPVVTLPKYSKEKLKTTMSRVAEDRAGYYLPKKLIGAVLKARGGK